MELNTEQLWLDFNTNLKRFVISKVKDEDVCKDILQDVFIKIHLNLKGLENTERVEQWVYQIARNAINDYFRKQHPMMDVEAIELPEEIIEQGNAKQFSKCMASFIKQLPEKYKEAITLVELENLNQLQLADKLNISYSGAKSRVQRGRELLKSYFMKCCNVSADKYGNIVAFKSKSTCTTCQI